MNTKTDTAMRARVAGRENVAARTVWQLDATALRIRCVLVDAETYELQGRTTHGWVKVAVGVNPMAMLKKISSLPAVANAVAEQIKRAKENYHVE